MQLLGAVLLGAVLLSACGGEPETVTSPDPVMAVAITMLDDADTDGFVDQLSTREPDRVAQFDVDELVELGELSCRFSDGYVTGSTPNPTDELVDVMVNDRGHPQDLAERIAPDIREATVDTLCSRTLVRGG